MPTPEQEIEALELEQELLKLQQDEASRKNRAGGDTKSKPGKGLPGGVLIDIGLEAGIPAIGQTLAAPLTPAGQAVVGSGLSIIGNYLAQARRLLMGEQEEFSTGQVMQAGATGAIPLGGPAKNAATVTARASRPVLSAVGKAITTGAKAAATGVGGEALKVAIDEGRLLSGEEAARVGAVTGVMGGGLSTMGSGAEALSTAGRRVGENVKDYGAVKATTGMLLPEEFAAAEQRMARDNPTGKVATAVDAARAGLKEQVQNIAPNPQEGAEIFKQVSPLLGQISKSEDEIAKLNKAAVDANAKAQEALQRLNSTRSDVAAAADTAGKAAAFKEAEELSETAFKTSLDSAMENARDISIAKVTGGATGVDPATARTMFVEHVAKPIEAAFEERAAQMYSMVDNQKPTFTAQPIIDYAEGVASEVTGGLPKKLDSSINTIRQVLGDDPTAVSLQSLRNTRSELLRKVRLDEFGSDAESRLIKGVIAKITSEIDTQAVTALGEEAGTALRSANKFYAETRPLFDQRGVEALFAKSPADEYVRQMVSGMEKAGVNADEYKNLQTLIKKIGESNPELAAQAQTQVAENLKRTIIFDASRIDTSDAAGALTVDGAALFSSLDKLARVPGTLEAVGLGNPAKVAELGRLFGKYPQSGKLTAQQWTELLDSPSFQEATNKGQLSVDLEPVLAASQAEAQLVKAANLRAAGKVDRSAAAYQAARETLRGVNGDLDQARMRYEELVKDPAAVAFNNPALSDSGFNSFAKALFDPKANAVTNKEVEAMASALRESPTKANKDLLLRLQERYIADKIAAYHSVGATPDTLKSLDADAAALFFNPSNPGDASNEIMRAAALLEPSQLAALGEFAKTAKAVSRYEKLGEVAVRPGSYDIPVVGTVRRGLDAIADLYREGEYVVASKLLANPEKAGRLALKVGDAADRAAQLANLGVQGTGRAVSNQPR